MPGLRLSVALTRTCSGGSILLGFKCCLDVGLTKGFNESETESTEAADAGRDLARAAELGLESPSSTAGNATVMRKV